MQFAIFVFSPKEVIYDSSLAEYCWLERNYTDKGNFSAALIALASLAKFKISPEKPYITYMYLCPYIKRISIKINGLRLENAIGKYCSQVAAYNIRTVTG